MRPNQKIRRDYNKPFFSNRKRGLSAMTLFIFGLLIGGIVVLTYWQYDSLQYAALNALGIAPTPTQFASQHAEEG